MGMKDAMVDGYIAQSAEFARPVLKHLRKLVHAGCPDVGETLKWGFPHFMYKGILCSMASFKAHCAFGFWKGKLIIGKNPHKTEKAMGQFGRITSIQDLPSETMLVEFVREAVRLNDAGIKSPTRSKPKTRKELVVPNDLAAALKKNKEAREVFNGFSYSNKRDYLEWITEAKTDETRSRRLKTAIEWLSEGKARNWKFMRK